MAKNKTTKKRTTTVKKQSKASTQHTKTVVKQPSEKTRQLKAKPYRSLRISKRIKAPQQKRLPSAFSLFKTSIKQLAKNWRLFGGITLVYLLLTVVLVKGFGSNSNITELRDTLHQVASGGAAEVANSFALFGVLISNVNGTTSAVASTYQTLLLLIVSLVLIYALRHTTSTGKGHLTVKNAFYKGIYPLIPFLLVILVISLQLAPLLIANFVYSAVFGTGLAVTPIEKGLWALLSVVFITFSFYMITSSIFALYIVTLPDLTPMKALRSARELVRYRRLLVLRKILFLPLVLMFLIALIILPIILLSPVLAEWVFFALSMASLAVFHSYMYNLYRNLL